QFLGQLEEPSEVPAGHSLETLFRKIKRINERLAETHISFFNDLKKYHRPAYQQLEIYQENQLRTFFIQNLQLGITEGMYRPDIELEIIARFCQLQFSIIHNGETFQPGQYDIKHVRRQIFKLFLMGIVTPRGSAFLADK